MHTSQYDELYEILTEKVSKLRFGSVLAPSDEGFVSPVDCGSMISSQRFEFLERIIMEAEESGADVEVGGRQCRHPYLADGAYFDGTVVGNVEPEMRIAQTERTW